MDKRIFGDNLPQNNILYWNTEKNIKINQSIYQYLQPCQHCYKSKAHTIRITYNFSFSSQ